MAEKRIPALDAAKGIGIIAIVFGHTLMGGWTHGIIYGFHIPLFFFLSGIFLSYSKPLKDLIRIKYQRLLVPYYFAGFLSILIYSLMGHLVASEMGKNTENMEFSVWKNLIGMVYANTRTGLMQWNRPLWFLPCLFLTSLMTATVEKYFVLEKNTRRMVAAGFFAIIGRAWSQSKVQIVLPFQFHVAINMVVWMELGLASRSWLLNTEFSDRMVDHGKNLLLAIGIFLAASVSVSFNPGLNVMSNYYGHYELYLLNTTAFLGAVLSFSCYLQKSRILCSLGRNTIPVLLFHKFPVLFFQTVCPFTRRHLREYDSFWGFVTALAVTAASILLCLCAGKILQYLESHFNRR